jgi:Fe2+ transport system protein B
MSIFEFVSDFISEAVCQGLTTDVVLMPFICWYLKMMLINEDSGVEESNARFVTSGIFDILLLIFHHFSQRVCF